MMPEPWLSSSGSRGRFVAECSGTSGSASVADPEVSCSTTSLPRFVPGLRVAMRRGLRQRLPLLLLLAVSGLMFTWQLDESGYANVYYSAAAQAGSVSWKALFFGSLDGANALTVD